jgi:hypothetical protein
VPASKPAGLDAGEKPLAPVAVSVQSAASWVPPSSLMTRLTSVSEGASSSLVIVHAPPPPAGIGTAAQASYEVV